MAAHKIGAELGCEWRVSEHRKNAVVAGVAVELASKKKHGRRAFCISHGCSCEIGKVPAILIKIEASAPDLHMVAVCSCMCRFAFGLFVFASFLVIFVVNLHESVWAHARVSVDM